jgi:dTDP-4-amino-4,6-dideoxygalactose transaminase
MQATTEYIPVSLSTVLRPPATGDTDSFGANLPFDRTDWYPSCRAAILAALSRAGLDEDDEVILPGYTCYAVDSAVKEVATPVYVDVEADFAIDAGAVRDVITERTAAILPTHLYGFECEMKTIASIADKHDLLIVEDAAQAFGNTVVDGTVGTYGDATAFSFRFYKEATVFKGGVLATDRTTFNNAGTPAQSDSWTNRSKMTGAWIFDWMLQHLPGRLYQPLRKRVLDPLARLGSGTLGETGRQNLREWTGRMLVAQIKSLPERVETRRCHAEHYHNLLPDSLDHPPVQPGATYFRYPIQVPATIRGAVVTQLRRRGIGCSPMYAYTVSPDGECPTADRIADRIVNLPVHAGLDDEDVEVIAAEVTAVLDELV